MTLVTSLSVDIVSTTATVGQSTSEVSEKMVENSGPIATDDINVLLEE